MTMTESEITRVCDSVRRGAQMLVGRNHMGLRKIKLVRGPFGLFVERYECTDEELSKIKARIDAIGSKQARTHSAA
jgi:hypothetical protein